MAVEGVVFEEEFTKLVNILLEISEGSAELTKSISLYKKAYALSLDPSKHKGYFNDVYKKYRLALLTEREMGDWLDHKDEPISIIFAKGKSGASLPLTEVYRRATFIYNRAKANPSLILSKPNSLLYTKIVLLHLYRIFSIDCSTSDTVNVLGRIKRLEDDLRGNKDAPSMDMASIAASLIESVKGNLPPQYAGVADKLLEFAKAPDMNQKIGDITKAVSDLGGNAQNLYPIAMEGLQKFQSGQSDFMTVVNDIFKNPNVSSTLDPIRDHIVDASNMMRDAGFDMPEELTQKLKTAPIGDVMAHMMKNTDTAELRQLSDAASSMLKDPGTISKYIPTGMMDRLGLSTNSAIPDDMPLSLEDSKLLDETTPQGSQIHNLVSQLNSLPPEQLQALLGQLGSGGARR